MTSTTDAPAPPGGAATESAPAGRGVAVLMFAVRSLLARPLASYYLLLASVGLLLVFGLIMIFSATAVTSYSLGDSPYTYLIQQLAAAAVGLVAFWICQRLPRRTYRAAARLLMIFATALLALLDLINVAAGPDDTARLGPFTATGLWLNIGGVVLQPSELAKFALVVWGADVLVRKGDRILQWRELVTPLFPVVGLLFVLVGYADLGTMLVLLAIFVGMLFVAGVRGRIFAGMLGIAVIGAIALVFAPGKSDYRRARFTAFLDPEHCGKLADCYQIRQAWYAIADGGWFGVGLGNGSVKWNWLPEAHNDFIFAVIAEELGVVGCLMVVLLFAVLAYSGLRIARRVPDPFRRIAAAAVTIWFVSQAMINIGGVVRLIPVTGLVLPFISHGGSALVVSLAAVGMLASFARTEPQAAAALHAHPGGKWVRLLWAPLPAISRRHRPPDAAAEGTTPTPGGAGTTTAARPKKSGRGRRQ
jgi:cell division protein FtsW